MHVVRLAGSVDAVAQGFVSRAEHLRQRVRPARWLALLALLALAGASLATGAVVATAAAYPAQHGAPAATSVLPDGLPQFASRACGGFTSPPPPSEA